MRPKRVRTAIYKPHRPHRSIEQARRDIRLGDGNATHARLFCATGETAFASGSAC